MELNVNIPAFTCFIRNEYLYNLEKGHGDFTSCIIFGCASIQGRAIQFHCMLDNGAVIYRLPISAFVHKKSAITLPLHYLELWDCFSEHITFIEYDWLYNLKCEVYMKNRTWEPGMYMFTLDWYGSEYADNPGDIGHKCAHIIKLDNGCFAAQPNNRIKWFEPSFCIKPFPDKPDYITNNHVWSVERSSCKWVTEDSDKMFYDVEDKSDTA